jgi:hypothetical protein
MLKESPPFAFSTGAVNAKAEKGAMLARKSAAVVVAATATELGEFAFISHIINGLISLSNKLMIEFSG